MATAYSFVFQTTAIRTQAISEAKTSAGRAMDAGAAHDLEHVVRERVVGHTEVARHPLRMADSFRDLLTHAIARRPRVATTDYDHPEQSDLDGPWAGRSGARELLSSMRPCIRKRNACVRAQGHSHAAFDGA